MLDFEASRNAKKVSIRGNSSKDRHSLSREASLLHSILPAKPCLSTGTPWQYRHHLEAVNRQGQ